MAGGDASRSGTQAVEPGALPATPAWSYGDAVRTPAIVTDGARPAEQRVAYGGADGRVHLRSLATGEQAVAPVTVVDSPLTDPATVFGPGVAFASAGGLLFVPHDDGGGVDVARIDLATGIRLAPDAAVPGSLGCEVSGSPLLTPPAADGSRLLLFTVAGGCSGGPALVRVPIAADGTFGPIDVAAEPGLAEGVAPALLVLGSPPQFVVAVAREDGIDLRVAGGTFGAKPDGSVVLGATPAALAAPDTAPLPTPALVALASGPGGTRVTRLDQAADGSLSAAAGQTLPGAPVSVAIGGAAQAVLAVSTTSALTVLRAADLTVAGSSPGAAGGVSTAGDLAFAVRGGRLVAVRLADASAADLTAAAGSYSPALARGVVTLGPVAVRTTDVTAPGVAMPADARGLRTLSALASDDRGIASVTWRLGRKRLATSRVPANGSPYEPGALYSVAFRPAAVAPGRYSLSAIARDDAGNAGRARRPVRVACGHVRRGGAGHDVLRGGAGRDCLYGRGGPDLLIVRGGGADSVACGPGRDLVNAGQADRVADDCERIRRHGP